MDIERNVAAHYARPGLEAAILEALEQAGKRIDPIEPADLAAIDEFHFGWGPVTAELANDAGFTPSMHVLDIGSGIGGPARHVARACGCRVTGVDLTEDFVTAANALTRRCGLADRVAFKTGSALALPFPEASFDGAMLMHVGMNIADKPALFAEARRVLKPGGTFVVYDLMRSREAPIPYPMPWAASADTSFVEPAHTYRTLLEATGFRIEREEDRAAFGLELFAQMQARAEAQGPSPLGMHVLVGPATQERLSHAIRAVQQGIITPIELLARAV
jgi:ubiquinone/menaquinone biosynthesis C-methylase UbiE